MRYFFLLILTFFAASISAETIGNIEYHLPEGGKAWRIFNELEGTSNSKTVIYIPDRSSDEDIQEFFGVSTNSKSSAATDQYSLEKTMENMFTDKEIKVHVNIIEKTSDSVLFEFSIVRLGEEIAHGWSRSFTSPQGTTVLTYQTENINEVDTQRPIWLKVLRNVKEKK